MKWEKEWIEHTGYTEPVLKLTSAEVDMLRKVLKKPLAEYRKKFERLEDIHQSGEATIRQENLRMEAEWMASFIERIMDGSAI